MAKKKKRGLGSLLREQVEETPVVRQSVPTASAPVNNGGGGIGGNFRSTVKQETATQKAERERSQRMRQGLSTIARSTFKMQAQNPLAPTKTGGQGVGNYGFKSHVRQILAPVKQDIRENPYDAIRKVGMKGSVNERKIYRPLSERDENGQVSTNQRRLENAARGGNRKAQVEAEMGRTKAKTVGGRTYDQFINAELNKKGLMGQDYILRSKDPSQEALDYRKQYGFDEEARQMVNDMADSPFKLGLGESYRARDVEDTLRRQYGVDLNDEEQARLNEARDSMAYMGGNVLGQASQFALTAPLSPLVEEGLMARAGLQGGRAAITTAKDALKYAGARIGADQIVSAPINLLDALKEDNGADIIKRFGMNTAMDVIFGGLIELPSFRKNMHFTRAIEMNNAANATDDAQKKLVAKVGAQRELNQALEEVGSKADDDAVVNTIYNSNKPVSQTEAEKIAPTSAVRKDDGELRIMYHGSVDDFWKFDKDKIRPDDYDAPFNGFWFSSNEHTSPAFRDAKYVKAFYLDIKNPAPMNVWRTVAEQVNEDNLLRDGARSYGDEVRYRLQDMGYDGVHWDGAYRFTKNNLDEFNRIGKTTFNSTRGYSYDLIKGSDGSAILVREGGDPEYNMIDEFVNGEDFFNINNTESAWRSEDVWVAFEPEQIIPTRNSMRGFTSDTDRVSAHFDRTNRQIKTHQQAYLKDDELHKYWDYLNEANERGIKGKDADKYAQRRLLEDLESAGNTADDVARRYTNLQEYGSVDEPTEDIVMQMRRGAKDLDSPAIADDGAEAGERFAALRNRTDGSEIPKQRNRVYGNIQETTAREAAEDVVVKDSERSLESLLNELEEIEDNAYRLGIDEPPRADEIDAELQRRGINLWETDEGELQRLIDEDNLARQTTETPTEAPIEKIETPTKTPTEKVETSAEKVEQQKKEPKPKEEPKTEAEPKEPKKETKPKKEKKPKPEPKDWKRVESGYKNKDTATLKKDRENVLEDVAKGNITKAEADKRLELIDNAIKSKKQRDLDVEAVKNNMEWGDPNVPHHKTGAPKVNPQGNKTTQSMSSVTQEGKTHEAITEESRRRVLEEGAGTKDITRGFDKNLENAKARYDSDPVEFEDSLMKDISGQINQGRLPKSRNNAQDCFDDIAYLLERTEKEMEGLDEASDEFRKLKNRGADLVAGYYNLGSQMGAGLNHFKQLGSANDFIKDELVNRELGKLEEQFKKRLEKRGIKELKLPKEMRDAIKKAKAPEDVQKAWRDASIYIWNQIPASPKEKIDFMRINGMLFNPATHIRNMLGNLLFVPLREAKNVVGTPMESLAVKLNILDKGERTKAIRLVKENMDYGGEILKEQGDVLRGVSRYFESLSGGRPMEGVEKFTDIFKPNVLKSKTWMAGRENGDPIINGIRKFADSIGDANSWALEHEDFVFFNLAFKEQMSRTMTARGLTVDMLKKNEKLRNDVIEVATQEALRATYRDESALAKAISGLKNPKVQTRSRKFIAASLDAILPFTKTPINIMRRAIDYSPVGFAKGSVNFWTGFAKKDQKMIVKGIDQIASSVPGSGVAAVGFFAAKHDKLTGNLGNDDDEQFLKDLGKQKFSFVFDKDGDKEVSFTLDWAAPACIPLFTGVATYNVAKNHGFDDINFWEVADLFDQMLEPAAEMSVMRGIKDTFETLTKNSDGNPLRGITAVGLNTGLNYINQIINPTLKGKVARQIDPIRRDTSSSADSSTKRIVEKWINKQIASTPFLSEILEPYQNVWGENQKNTWSENPAGRFLENFVAPGYLKEYNPDSVDKKLLDIIDKDPSAKGIIPEKNWRGEVSFKGGTVKLTKEEITQYNKMQNNKQEMKKLIDSADFKNKSLSEQEKAISNFNTDQKVKATRSILLKQGKDAYEVYTDSYDEGKKKHYQDAKNAGIPAKTYDEILHDTGADRSGNGRLTQAEAVLYLNKREDLTDPQRAIMFDYMADANNPYKDGTAYTKDWEAEYAKREKSNAKRNNTKDRKILEQAEKRDGGMASKLFNTSINKMSEQVAKEREELGGSSSSRGGSKRGRSGRGGSGKSKTKAREKTASEKRFAALQTGKAPDIAKGIEGLNISGLSKSQRKALLKLMQKKLDV